MSIRHYSPRRNRRHGISSRAQLLLNLTLGIAILLQVSYPLLDGEKPEIIKVRFRTLGCYPLTAAVESTATSITEIVEEVFSVKLSERATRLIDGAAEDSMEKKKTEGYF